MSGVAALMQLFLPDSSNCVVQLNVAVSLTLGVVSLLQRLACQSAMLPPPKLC